MLNHAVARAVVAERNRRAVHAAAVRQLIAPRSGLRAWGVPSGLPLWRIRGRPATSHLTS